MKANQEKLSSVCRVMDLTEQGRALIERLINQEIADASRSGYEKGVREAAEKCSGWVLAEDAKKSILKSLDLSQ